MSKYSWWGKPGGVGDSVLFSRFLVFNSNLYRLWTSDIYPNSGCEVVHLMSFHLMDDTFLDRHWLPLSWLLEVEMPRGSFLLHCLIVLWRKWFGNTVSSSHRCSWWLSCCSSDACFRWWNCYFESKGGGNTTKGGGFGTTFGTRRWR